MASYRSDIEKKSRGASPILLFCVLSTICLVVLAGCFLISRGELLNQYFFTNKKDTAMDFFHSLEYVKRRMPYIVFNTLYPPLANAFFYVLYLFIPDTVTDAWVFDFSESVSLVGTEYDLRTKQSCMILFIVIVVLAILLFVKEAQRWLDKSPSGVRDWCIFCCCFSYGMLYALERGNIVLLCLPLILFYLSNYCSENPFLKELALLALAAAAGFKLYPAFFGVLLLRRRDFSAAFRAVVYGIAALILPTFVFREGLVGLSTWVDVLLHFGSANEYKWLGVSAGNIWAGFCTAAGLPFHETIGTVSSLAAACILLLCALCFRSKWRAALAVTLATVLFQFQEEYIFALFLIPLLLYFRAEDHVTKRTLLPFFGMLLLVLPLPLFYVRGEFYPRNTLAQIVIVVLAVWCVCSAIFGRAGQSLSAQPKRRPKNEPARNAAAFGGAVLLGVVGYAIWSHTKADTIYLYQNGFDTSRSWGIQDGYEQDAVCEDSTAALTLYSTSLRSRDVVVTMEVTPASKKGGTLALSCGETQTECRLDGTTQTIAFETTLHSGENELELSYDGAYVTVWTEERILEDEDPLVKYYTLEHLTITDQ